MTPGAARDWEGRPVLAAMLNGAQGDDDEAHGGHFAMVTGRVGPDGAIGDWLADNFYTLDAFSEKGIVASVVPLDNYLADLNSGQAWYRPSYLIVAILRDERTASRIQGALCRVYNHFYRHQLVYDHATMNCASISVDALRATGWRVSPRGATARLLAAAGVPYFAVRERSFDKAAKTYNYLTEDRTRLFPAIAFEDIATSMLRLARATRPMARAPSSSRASRRTSMRSSFCVCHSCHRAAPGATGPSSASPNTGSACPIPRWRRSFRCRRGPFPIRCAIPGCSRRRRRDEGRSRSEHGQWPWSSRYRG